MQNSRNFTSIVDIKNIEGQRAHSFTAFLSDPLTIDTTVPHGIKVLLVSITSSATAAAADPTKRLIIGTSIVANSRVVGSNASILYISDFPVPGPSLTTTKAVSDTWTTIPLAPATGVLSSIPILLQSSVDGTFLTDVESIGITFEIVQLESNKQAVNHV